MEYYPPGWEWMEDYPDSCWMQMNGRLSCWIRIIEDYPYEWEWMEDYPSGWECMEDYSVESNKM